MGVDVLVAGGTALDLLAKLSDEHVDRAVAVGHRVTPDLLVDGLAFEDVALVFGKEVEEFELTPGQVQTDPGDEGLRLLPLRLPRLLLLFRSQQMPPPATGACSLPSFVGSSASTESTSTP